MNDFLFLICSTESLYTTAGPDFEIVDGVADIEIPTEIFEDKSEATGSDKEVVLKLLSDLEQIDAIVVDVNNTVERIEEGPMNGGGEVLQTRKDGEWTQNGKPSSPRENLQSQGECRVVSPNGFQVLSGIREEGEIDEEEEENGTMRNDGFHLQEVGGNKEERGDASESQERELQTSHAPLYHSRSALKLFHSKLKSLKGDLRGLNKDLFGDLPSRVKLAYEDLCLKQAVNLERRNLVSLDQLWFVKYEQRQDGLFVELATDNSERLSTRLKLFS
ncbi:hypothetical protein IGI04_008465 [Brassica rapa subsp. trilocularis]|uniref:Uncharacterized protein n=1 Tax=Brassica rapa subsp. trilocularis TaxID=1813537 RepID=A0ABQ7NPT1_BRACM|nr:hypothetical protein IGI04_008465 [Brassica rapa subsp. trilocularis]